MSPGADDDAEQIVQVELVLPAGALPSAPVRVVLQIEDVSRMDAPSPVVAERRLEGVELRRLPAGSIALPVSATAIDPRRSYSVRVHIDANRSGSVELGDMVSTASYPVLTRGAGLHARVVMKKV